MMKPRWHHERNYFGHTQDATVESSASGSWRVTKTNIETGSEHVRVFRGAAARKDALQWAWMVNLPPLNPALL